MNKEIEKMSFEELCNTYDQWKLAVIVFKQSNFFDKEYSEIERSFEFSFNKTGNLLGNCLDGKYDCCSLDSWLIEGAEIDYCYIVRGVYNDVLF